MYYDILVLVSVSLFVVLAIVLVSRNLKKVNIFKNRQNRRIAQLWRSAQASMRENNFLQAEKALLTILNLDRKNAAAYNLVGIL